MTPPFRPFLLLEKESEQVIPSAQFSGLWLWVRNHFWSLTKLFCRWHYRALNCSVLLWIQSYFPRFSVSDLFAPSYRCCFVAVPQVALSLHSHDDSSYFYSRVFVIVFKSPTSSCFASVVGPFAASFFVTVLLFNIISVADHLAPSCCFVELIAILQVVLSGLLVVSKTRYG